jgi:hypothetical protein
LFIFSSGRTTGYSKDHQVCSQKISGATTYRDFTANIEGQQNVELTKK